MRKPPSTASTYYNLPPHSDYPPRWFDPLGHDDRHEEHGCKSPEDVRGPSASHNIPPHSIPNHPHCSEGPRPTPGLESKHWRAPKEKILIVPHLSLLYPHGLGSRVLYLPSDFLIPILQRHHIIWSILREGRTGFLLGIGTRVPNTCLGANMCIWYQYMGQYPPQGDWDHHRHNGEYRVAATSFLSPLSNIAPTSAT